MSERHEDGHVDGGAEQAAQVDPRTPRPGPRVARFVRGHAGKLVAGCGAVVMLAVLGVVAVQAEEVRPCWSDFHSLTDTEVFPDAFGVPQIGGTDNPAIRAALRDPLYRQATRFTGDQAVGKPVWTVVAQGPLPVMTDEFGLLPARGGAAPRDLAMYEGRSGKRHWMRTAEGPLDTFMKNLRSLTFVPHENGDTQVMGADARSGYAQWCQAVPVTPAVADPERDRGWVTGMTGNGGTVLMVGTAPGGRPDTSRVAQQDTVSGRIARRWDVPGRWTDVAADGRTVYLAAPGALAAFAPGAARPTWKAELPDTAGTVGFTAVTPDRILASSRPADGGAGTLTAFDHGGRPVWTLRGTDPDDVAVTGDTVLAHETRAGADGVAAYRVTDGTPLWFTPVPGLARLADGGTDGTTLYLPGGDGLRVLRIADGRVVPSTLTVPVDRVFVTGQRIVVEHTASAKSAWTVAYSTPQAPADTSGSDGDPRSR